MARYDEKKLPYDKQNAALDLFCSIISRLGTKEAIYNFLKDLLNRKERMMLVRRLLIAKYLLDGWTYAQIRQELNCASNTISRVQRWLDFGRGGYKKATEKILKEETQS
ncbi:MAG: YerC/YecD family TrpR-related protein [Parcubacteria group bacterium]